jgi:hypothetical protein
MGLPKFNTPTYSLVQPSTQKNIRYRPFLVKEEKILLMAKESNEDNDVYSAVKDIVQNCILEDDFNVNDIPIYDLEYIFIKLRSTSVSNIVKFQVEDSDDGITYDLEIDLDEVEVQFPVNHTNKYMITDEIGIIMKPPTPEISDKIKNMTSVSDVIYETVKHCIDVVFDNDDTHKWSVEPDHEKDMFLESIPLDKYKEIGEYFKSSPKIEYVVTYKNSTDKEKRVVFRNINDFFMLG